MLRSLIEPVSEQSVVRAAKILNRGGLVAFPTETVYGLGANGLDESAAARIYTAKGRPPDNPLILHIADISMAYELAAQITPAARALMDKLWPGPLTLILPKKPHIPDNVTGGLDTVGIRMPAHTAAAALIRAAGVPLAAPSANSSGRPSPTCAGHVSEDLGERIDMILDGGDTRWGLESTVVEVTESGVCVLRLGAVTLESLRELTPCTIAAGTPLQPKAPGMKYRHYSPKASLTLVRGETHRVSEYINNAVLSAPGPVGILATAQTLQLYDSQRHIVVSMGDRSCLEGIAAGLFGCLREFDRLGAASVYAEGIDERGLGLTIMDRLGKAAAGKVVEV